MPGAILEQHDRQHWIPVASNGRLPMLPRPDDTNPDYIPERHYPSDLG